MFSNTRQTVMSIEADLALLYQFLQYPFGKNMVASTFLKFSK